MSQQLRHILRVDPAVALQEVAAQRRPESIVDAAWAAYSSSPAAVATAAQKLKLHPAEEAKLAHLQQRQRDQREDALQTAENKLNQAPRRVDASHGSQRTGAHTSGSPYKSAWRAGVAVSESEEGSASGTSRRGGGLASGDGGDFT